MAYLSRIKDLPCSLEGKESACNAGDPGSIPASGRSSPVFLPGEPHRQRNLAGYSPLGRKELDTTEQPALLLLSWTKCFP